MSWGGCGETIILELPDGSFGIVDTYCHSPKRFPAPDFLRNSLGAASLRFIAATHPHSDHCRGIARLGREFVAEECWVFDAISDQNLREYFAQVKKLGGKDVVDVALKLPPGTIAVEIMQLHHYVVEKSRQPPPSKPRLMRVPKQFEICAGEVTVTVLAPGDRASIQYKDSIRAALSSMTEDGRTISPKWSGGEVRPNLICGSLLIQYGKTRLILMGDSEVPLWKEWDEERKSEKALNTEPVQFL